MTKSAPPKHKEKNKYRFKTFSERLALVNIDAVHQIKHVQENEDGSEDFSYFSSCLEKWRDLDLSVHFSGFKKDIVGKCKNYKLVLHYGDDLNEALQRHLVVEESLALPALLELTVALCNDLSSDFYPHFPKYFAILTGLLHTQDVEKLEATFSALTLLFRHQWRCMVQDMGPLLDMYATLVTSEQPEHIGSFAAESISFLLRKTRDRKFVVERLFKMAKQNQAASNTVAQILFNVVKSAQHHFHSCIGEYLSTILSFLKSETNADNVFATVSSAVKLMGDYTSREQGAPVWKILILELAENCKVSPNEIYVVFLLKLLTTWCQVRKGARLFSYNDLQQLFKSLQAEGSVTVQSVLCDLLSAILCGSNSALTTAEKRNLLQLFTGSGIACSLACSMWKAVCCMEDFEAFGKNTFLKFCQTHIQNSEDKYSVLSLLTEFICSRQELPATIDDVECFVPIRLDFTVVSRESKAVLPGKILADIIKTESDSQILWNAILCLQHIHLSMLVQVLESIFLQLLSNCDNQRSLAVVAIATQALYSTKKLSSFTACHRLIMNLLEDWPSNRHSLFAVSLLIKCCPSAPNLPTEAMKRCLVENVSSFSSPVRLISLQILQKLNPSDTTAHCMQTELITASVQDIRDKLLHVGKLMEHRECAADQETKEIALRFLLANFSINFSPLWNGLQEVICSLASGNKNDIFWSVFFDVLSQASDDAEISQWWKVDNGDKECAETEPDSVFESYVQCKWSNGGTVINARIDCYNFRLQMWKTLSAVPHFHIAEAHNRILVNLLFCFLEEEYYQVDKTHSPVQSLGLQSDATLQEEKVHRRKDGVKMLEAMLTVFAKFTNVNSAFRGNELQDLYGELLTHTDTEIQNVALQCLFTCKGKGMLKYKEQFTGFFDPKKFRDTLVGFDVSLIKTDDRDFVISMLLRFLFGRLKSKTGSSTGMKSSLTAGRAMIIRFLCNLHEKEVCTFVDLVIAPFGKMFDFSVDLAKAIELAETSTAKSQVCLPLSRQQGILSTIKTIIAKLRHKLTLDHYSMLLKLLLCCEASLKVLLNNQSNTIDKKFFPQIKSLNKAVTECITDLLDLWPSSALLSLKEVDSIFKVIVTPNLERQVYENSGSPTMLLRFFGMLSTHVKYRPLFLKTCTSLNSTPMHTIVKILTSPKASLSVATFVLDIFTNLLVEPSDEDEEATPSLDDAICSAGKLSLDFVPGEEFSVRDFGMIILKPHLSSILSYFMRKLTASRKDASLQPKYLDLLSEISEIATDETLLHDLSKVLLTHVIAVSSKSSRSPEKTLIPALKVLSTIIDDSSLAGKLSKLFSKINDREARLLLVKVYCRACAGDDKFAWTCDVVKHLNAWDKRRLEEIDFDSRLTAFQDILAKLRSENFADLFADRCLLLLPVLHSCMHTLLHYHADISLRESVSRVLELLIEKVQQLSADEHDCFGSVYQIVMCQMMFPTIQTGLWSLDEGCRHEAISLLSKVVRTFPNEPVVKNLTNLSNWNDPEDDFYENIRHIQLHRRARAFRRLAKFVQRPVALKHQEEAMETDEKDDLPSDRLVPSPVAEKFLLPIAVQSLYSTDFSKHVHLKDACLEAVKSCCSVMPWPQFKRFLLRSVQNIDKHKLGLEVVCGTLEVFPFDLSKAPTKLVNGREKPPVVEFPEVKDNGETESDDEKMETDAGETTETPLTAKSSSILDDVTNHVIPKLQGILNRKDSDDDQHKLSSSKADIERCKKKIPLALAIVSVLRKLPEYILKSQLSGVVLKLVGFLRHKLHEVRVLATSTVVKIVGLLSLPYVSLVLREMKAGLSKGYQKHVLVSASYAIAVSLGSRVEVGDIDFCIPQLLEILNEDLFGATAAEKKVDKLQSKIPEARGRSKAYASYKILASVVGRTSIMALIEPVKARLEDTRNHSVKKIARDLFVEISLGLLENKSLTAHDFLTLTYGILSEKIPGLFSEEESKPTKEEDILLRPLSLILAPEPARYGTKAPAKSVKTNMHLLAEFGLQLLHSAIKRQIVNLAEQNHLEMLDQFTEKLKGCLKSGHQQTVVDAIRCLTRLFRTDLPSVNAHRSEITASLFKILRDQTKGACNQEMAAVTFKSLCVLCSTEHGVVMSETQLKLLLAYAEEDLYNTQRQSHAFDLIKSILKRGLQCSEVVEAIEKVRKIAIQSHTPSARAQARSLYLHFVVNYPLVPRQLDTHFEFVLAQLAYEFEEGRASSLEMLSTVVTTFPSRIVSSHAGVIFVPVAAVLINDDSARCRKMAAGVLKFLLERLDVDNRSQLFSLVMHWYESDDTKQRRLAAMVVSIFCEVMQTSFQNHASSVLLFIQKNISHEENSADMDDENVKTRDHDLFFHLSAFLALLRHCDVITYKDVTAELESVLERVTELLAYPHDWVRLACCQILGCIFAQFSPSEFSGSGRDSVPYFRRDVETKLGDLCQRFYMQLKADVLSAQLAEQVVKNLIFALRVLDCLKQTESTDTVHPVIVKLLKQFIFISKFEQSDKPKETGKRTAVLKLCAALSVNLPNPERVLKLLLEPIYRGVNASATHGNHEIESVATLRTLATQVLDVVKSKVDSEVFSKTYLAVTRKITHKRRERKREKAVQLVADPRKAAAFKLKKQERTKTQRKRKIASMRPEYGLAAKMKRP